MKKAMKVFLSLLLVAALFTAALPAVHAETDSKSVEGAVVIPAKDALFTEGKGVSFENKKTATTYDAEHGMIVNIAKDGEIVFTVPDGVEGSFDVYLTVSKVMTQFTSQYFAFSINEEEAWSVPLDCQVSADALAKDDRDGAEYNTGTIYDDGRFLIAENVALKAGDTIKLLATYGAKAANLKGATFPGVLEVTLAPAGAEVGVGYDYVIPEKREIDPDDPLSGKTILWIGSSVTYGAHAGGHYSMVDAIQDRHPALICEKYAISATTLVNTGEDSYVGRLKRIPKSRTPDLIVVQLSTNDATTNKPFGEISDSTDIADFDDSTIAGAIETIIAYARDTFNCPVAFYSGSFCEKENYAEMVQLLLDIQKKWDICVVDLFHNEEMTAIYGSDLYNTYMFDEVHPTRAGYVEWWTPVMDAELSEYMSSLA
ncbi:MAG: SGNH/GDSL hydrolase family protein [Anaerolineaceae bacterium]|nr:SGNH/GDSL hydrolase family protein [Oscillospiraceae bacterium]MBQ6479819.1 SGNH/GDSL hydrolase family protein [Anaerolineaceae bacterium]